MQKPTPNNIPGTYKLTPAGHKAFIPQDLPPKLNIPSKTLSLVEEATYRLGQVEMCRTLLPNADLLIYSSLQNEALASSTIEGTIVPPQELVLFQLSERNEKTSTREVANYRVALEWGCEQILTLPITTNLILGLHSHLMDSVRGASSAGRFKVHQNAIGSPNDTIEQAVFVPSPPEEVHNLVSGLERYINLEAQEAKIVQCALTHYQFETIHPFADGNGRVGRLLIILQLIQLGLLSAPLIYPSVYFERNRSNYYGHLQAVRERGNWNAWIHFFAEGIIQQCKATLDFTQTILTLRQNIQSDIGHVRQYAAVGRVLDALFESPIVSISNISKMANMSYHSAQNAIEMLEKRGIVRELSGKKHGKVYACNPVMQAIFRPVQERNPDQDVLAPPSDIL